MIPANFTYMRAYSLEEAVEAYLQADRADLSAEYYAGGTEIVSYARLQKIEPDVVIDLKKIPECSLHGEEDGSLVFGACLTLNDLVDDAKFPLLSRAAHIIDHTIRNRLTLGGNIAGRLPYRETVLPFLLADATARIFGPEGSRDVPLAEVFDKRLKLKRGELLVQLRVDEAYAAAPWFYGRRTKNGAVDYPVVTGCFLRWEGSLRMALTGVYGFPLRSLEAEEILNDADLSVAERAAQAVEAVSFPIFDDERASADYRRMLTEKLIVNALVELGG